jgi:hypothetical protein
MSHTSAVPGAAAAAAIAAAVQWTGGAAVVAVVGAAGEEMVAGGAATPAGVGAAEAAGAAMAEVSRVPLVVWLSVGGCGWQGMQVKGGVREALGRAGSIHGEGRVLCCCGRLVLLLET